MLLPACSKWIDRYLNIFGFSGPKDQVNLILNREAIFYPPVNIHSMTMGAFIHYGRPTGHKLAERNFPIKPGQPKGMTLSIFFIPFSNPYISHRSRAMKQFVKMKRQISTTSRGGSEYSGRNEPRRTYPFDFRLNFPKCLA